MEHMERLATFRKLLKSRAKTFSVKNGTGTAWGWTQIRGSAEFGKFTDTESAVLQALNIPHGANYAVIEYSSLEFWINKLRNAA